MFKLNKTFVNKYRTKKAPFGFNGLGEVVYRRTYSRLKEDGTNEDWWETVQRVVEGCYNMQMKHVKQYKLGWLDKKAQQSAQEMYDLMFNMKFLPPGRGLWAMGSPITEERKLFSALNNCAFVSTEDLKEDKSKPFCFLMDMSMLGVGVGFDTKGSQKVTLHKPGTIEYTFAIPDTREGWVESLERLLESYFNPDKDIVNFDYSLIRPEGAPIKGFGGKCSGYKPLEDMHISVRKVLDPIAERGGRITVTAIVDIMNLIGKAVVAGNVRRSAEIAFGDPRDEEFLDLKDPELYGEELTSHRWASNNTVFGKVGMPYTNVASRTRKNGEPGYAWLENMQAFGRMGDSPDWKDKKAKGGNPCLEQTLESYELCCLVEVFPDRCTDLIEYLRTLKYAYLYAKTVTLGQSHWAETNRVMLRNRRIGCSMSGLVQFISNRGLGELHVWCNQGYSYIRQVDKTYSDWLCIPTSIKCTSVKPSGSVSKLPGATSGVHWPISRYCKVRVRVAKNHKIIENLKAANYSMEECIYNNTAMAVEFPVDHGEGLRAEDEVSCWEKISLASFMQRFWADNQVSATITFDPKTEGKQIEAMLDYFQYQLKGVSFLPMGGAYKQMSYEPITKQQYEDMASKIKPIRWTYSEDSISEKFCDTDACQIDFSKLKNNSEVAEPT
jgi:adenosylcobalamin-dependent ribonucleoside-triphosphate reductase